MTWWEEHCAAEDAAVVDAGGFIFRYPNSECGLALCLYPDGGTAVGMLARDMERGGIDLAACCQKELWELMHWADQADCVLARHGEPAAMSGPGRGDLSRLWFLLLRHLDPENPLAEVVCPAPGPHHDWRPISRIKPGQMELFT